VTGRCAIGKRSPDTARLAAAGMLGDFIDPPALARLQVAIDIDGYSNAWSNLFTRS